MKSLPRILYVKLENPGDGEPFANAVADPKEHAVIGEKVLVGVYELKHRTVVSTRVEFA